MNGWYERKDESGERPITRQEQFFGLDRTAVPYRFVRVPTRMERVRGWLVAQWYRLRGWW